MRAQRLRNTKSQTITVGDFSAAMESIATYDPQLREIAGAPVREKESYSDSASFGISDGKSDILKCQRNACATLPRADYLRRQMLPQLKL